MFILLKIQKCPTDSIVNPKRIYFRRQRKIIVQQQITEIDRICFLRPSKITHVDPIKRNIFDVVIIGIHLDCV